MNPHPLNLRPARLLAVLAAFASLSSALPAQQAGTTPVKIYVLVGQSNMQGMGEAPFKVDQSTFNRISFNSRSNGAQFDDVIVQRQTPFSASMQLRLVGDEQEMRIRRRQSLFKSR